MQISGLSPYSMGMTSSPRQIQATEQTQTALDPKAEIERLTGVAMEEFEPGKFRVKSGSYEDDVRAYNNYASAAGLPLSGLSGNQQADLEGITGVAMEEFEPGKFRVKSGSPDDEKIALGNYSNYLKGGGLNPETANSLLEAVSQSLSAMTRAEEEAKAREEEARRAFVESHSGEAVRLFQSALALTDTRATEADATQRTDLTA